MSYADTLGRRDFLRGAVVLAGTAYVGIATARRADATSTTQAWQLDPAWGYPRGAHGRTSCHCRACLSHAANKIFATESAALTGLAHTGCLCIPFSVSMDATIYDALFSGPAAVVVDRRDPDVDAILDSRPAGSFDAFGPDKGQVGQPVIVTGSGFTGATRVRFGRIPAPFTVDSDTQITATVPDGARTGAISVGTPDGTFSSVVEYVVKHRRLVTLTMTENETSGQVSVVDGLNECRRGVPVVVERFHGGRWNPVARTYTGPDGSFRVRAMAARGQYRAVAPWARLSSNDFCMVAVSPVFTR